VVDRFIADVLAVMDDAARQERLAALSVCLKSSPHPAPQTWGERGESVSDPRAANEARLWWGLV
jgi:hypothetical protein